MFLSFWTSGHKTSLFVKREIAETDITFRSMSCQQRDNLDAFCCGLLDIVITAVQSVAGEFFRAAGTLPGDIDGRMECIRIMFVSRLYIHTGNQVGLCIILFLIVIRFHYLGFISLTFVAVIACIRVGRVLETVR
jgi:hypothetical protein